MKGSVLFFIFLFLGPLSALGQTTGLSGYDINFFRPSRDGSGLWLVSGSKTLHPGEISVGADVHWAEGLFSAINVATGQTVRVVDHLLVGDVNLAAGIFKRVSLAVGVPVIIQANEGNIPSGDRFSFSGVGDMDVDVKFNILEDNKGSLGFAAISTASLPTGNPRRFTGFDNPTYWGRAVMDKKLGSVWLGANVGYRVVGSKQVLDVPVDDQLTFAAGLSYSLPRLWEIFGEVAGFTSPADPDNSNTPISVVGGVRKTFGRLKVHAAGGRGVSNGAGASELSAVGGVRYAFNLKKKKRQIAGEVVYFPFDSDRFHRKWEKNLDRIVEIFKKEKNSTIVISAGHTDSVGYEDYNMNLSQRRAENVAKYLVHRGIPVNRIEKEAHGENQPVSDNQTLEGKAKNRRVEVNVYN